MAGIEGRQLVFAAPFRDDAGLSPTGFLGVWCPHAPLSVHLQRAPGQSSCSLLRGQNWLLAAPHAAPGKPFYLHEDPASRTSLAFRGYISSPELHHNSPPRRIVDYWRTGFGQRQSGVFAVARIDSRDNSLRLRTDAFGFAPLYYRTKDGLVLFGTNPDFLSMPGDGLDELVAFGLISNGLPPGDDTLIPGVARMPVGTEILFQGSTRARVRQWFSFDDLPPADEPLQERHLKESEEALATSVAQCARMTGDRVLLPLSSGYDSRRILAHLLREKAPLWTATVRIFEKGYRDLDATFSRRLAGMYRLDHRIFDLPEDEGFALDDAVRRRLVGAETQMHTWALSFLRHAPPGPGVLMDGALGDVVSHSWIPDKRLYKDPKRDMQILLDMFSGNVLRKYVSGAFLQTEALADVLYQHLRPFAHRRNLAEFGYILLRQRRAITLWSQQMAPPATVVAYPYTDLDYIRATMRIRPEDRHASPLQATCLSRFHPRLAAVPGSHSVPDTIQPTGEALYRRHSLQCIRHMLDEQPAAVRREHMEAYLSPWGRMLIDGAQISPELTRRWAWFIQPALEVLLHPARRMPVWQDATERVAAVGVG